MSIPITAMRSLQYMQLDFFILREYCIEQGILKRTKRITPVGAGRSAGSPPRMDPAVAEGVLIRMLGQALRIVFAGCEVEKRRYLPEFAIALPGVSWWRAPAPDAEHLHPLLDMGGLGLSRFVRPERQYDSGRLSLLVAADGKAGVGRWNRRDRLQTTEIADTSFARAAKAAVEWKRRMDALRGIQAAPPPGSAADAAAEHSADASASGAAAALEAAGSSAQRAFEEAVQQMRRR
jgi:hypothetical protein